jgi:hypothetical protein
LSGQAASFFSPVAKTFSNLSASGRCNFNAFSTDAESYSSHSSSTVDVQIEL